MLRVRLLLSGKGRVMATLFGKAVIGAVLVSCAWTPAPHASASVESGTEIERSDARFRLLDRATGEAIIESERLDFHHYTPRRRASLEPEVEIVEHPNGFDLVYTYTNDRTQPMPLGVLDVDGIRLDGDFWWRGFTRDGGLVARDEEDPRDSYMFSYPQGHKANYSPVAVVETPTHVIGISLLYPLFEYKHDVRGRLQEVRLENDPGHWAFRWKLSDLGYEAGRVKLDYEALLPPGETRQYTVAVRVTNDRERWLETLAPYREYFHSLYGDVAYERDPRPVHPITLAGGGKLSHDNPYGFRIERFRPDLYGWGPLLEWLGDRRDLSGKRVMFWQPSGLQRINRSRNFPFKFTSFWNEGDEHGHAMGDAAEEFNRFASQNNVDVGFWWGSSSRVAERWDQPGFEYFDIENPEHVALAFHELEGAVAAGATIIGLDAFGGDAHVPTWDLARWIEMMQVRYPGVRFITERNKPDVLHRLAPTYYQAYDKTIRNPSSLSEIRVIDEPLYLADYLLPGHETWLSLRYILVDRARGIDVDDDFNRREYERALRNGFIPVTFGLEGGFESSDTAAHSWQNTVPPGTRVDTEPVEEATPTPRAAQQLKENRKVRTHTRPKR